MGCRLKEELSAAQEVQFIAFRERLRRWAAKRTLRNRLEAIKKVARSIRAHKGLILNWFVTQKQFSSSIVEGLNYKIRLTIRKAYGYRTFEVAETAIYHALVDLPEPKVAHEFC